jgi:hypothetical protein
VILVLPSGSAALAENPAGFQFRHTARTVLDQIALRAPS